MEEKIKLRSITVDKKNGIYPYSLPVTRELNYREVYHILIDILGFDIKTKMTFEGDDDEYEEYKARLTNDVNDWLVGDADDEDILFYAPYAKFSIFHLLGVISYLQQKKII